MILGRRARRGRFRAGALDALAVYRLTHLITEDSVPFGRLRDRTRDRWPDSHVAELINCPWCASMWVAPVVVALRSRHPAGWSYAAAVLAYSAVAGLLSTWEQRD